MQTNPSANNLPLLTIAIPTYNRAAKLDKCLTHIFQQLDKNDDRVEILVSDNCSPDHTGEIVSKHIHEGCRIRYIRNDENMGIDFNVSQCYKEASGQFAVAFGDDDILLDGAIHLILKAIQDHPNCGAIHLNAYRAKHKEGVVIPYKDPVEFIKEMHYDVTFISANIINTNLIDWDNLLSYRGTFLNHVNLLYEAIFQAPVNILIQEQLVVGAGIENSEGYNFYQVFGHNFNNIIQVMENKRNVSGIRKHINIQLLIHFFPAVAIIQKRNDSNFDRLRVHGLLAPVYRNCAYYWGFCLPIILLPKKNMDHKSYLRMKRGLYKLLGAKRVLNNMLKPR